MVVLEREKARGANISNTGFIRDGVEPDQIVAAVRSYLAADPKRQGQGVGAIFMVRDAVNKAFSCHPMFIKPVDPAH